MERVGGGKLSPVEQHAYAEVVADLGAKEELTGGKYVATATSSTAGQTLGLAILEKVNSPLGWGTESLYRTDAFRIGEVTFSIQHIEGSMIAGHVNDWFLRMQLKNLQLLHLAADAPATPTPTPAPSGGAAASSP